MVKKYDLYLAKDGAIATLFFNRPEKRNALTFDMWNKMDELLDEVEQDRNIKVLILRGIDETSFAAGADISEFKTLRYSAEGANTYNQATLKAEEKLAKLSKPTIAMIQSYCVGGGCELALACDFRFADTTGMFGITPAKLGLIYNLPGTKNLVDLVGPSNAKDILFSGRIIKADEAYHMRLIDRLYEPEEIIERTSEYAELIAKNAQMSVRGSKTIIQEVLNGEIKEQDEVARLVLSSFESEDYKEGVSAFLEKRKPKFTYS
ncbi:enoyl-CoA hydratase-related protein [Cytobacillus purgationiresistens]|uniref:Enoyl-CoA hydratase/carnithine racemase n=1 Tax=Cytobacillus purgationiresistens TaxID=863449 RepID=A0ABU0ALQ2_9BACI|nr:enoyl-CoA hydratase-related protein [Cytobacillus purgationiresistens]MDQ0272202.1 enoyl-CoA hydratase/carnithine racemase [Cytobacillus purgationiresistens]